MEQYSIGGVHVESIPALWTSPVIRSQYHNHLVDRAQS